MRSKLCKLSEQAGMKSGRVLKRRKQDLWLGLWRSGTLQAPASDKEDGVVSYARGCGHRAGPGTERARALKRALKVSWSSANGCIAAMESRQNVGATLMSASHRRAQSSTSESPLQRCHFTRRRRKHAHCIYHSPGGVSSELMST